MPAHFHRAAIVSLILASLVGIAPSRLSPALTHAASLDKPHVVYQNLALPNGQTALVFSNGIAQVFSKDRSKVEFRRIALVPSLDDSTPGSVLPGRDQVIADLATAPPAPYVDGELIVVYRDGVTATQARLTVPSGTLVSLRKAGSAAARAALAPGYTTSAALNTKLAALGVDRSERLFQQFDRAALKAQHDVAQSATGLPLLDFTNAYKLHVTGATVPQAVQTLLQSPDVAYVSPAWRVETMNTPPASLAHAHLDVSGRAASGAQPLSPAGAPNSANVPTNVALTSSAQSLLNTPSVDAVPAFDELGRLYNQLPGQGEIITNVSLGDLTDASAASNPSDPCSGFVSGLGPTTQIINGQRYINWPSMPLIPTYTADASGALNGTGEVCGVDPQLNEIGLDFSMMAPLPDSAQRPGFQGAGTADLLGIAPGASYRLVVPASFTPSIADVDAAFLGAAQQSPRPNVITASLGFGTDQYGFSARYLEDDPLTRSIVTTIVHADNIVVSIAGDDGIRTFTNVAANPAGGSTATNVIGKNGTPTDLNDIFLTTMPSLDPDSGAMAVGGTTLDDIFSAPPQDPANAALEAQHAFPTTRWNGFMTYSSGFGSRLNVSAPGDNVLSLIHQIPGDATAAALVTEGGDSAAAPEAAAAAAVALQTARLTAQHTLDNAASVRDFLAKTGNPVPAAPQTDQPTNVGPQIDVGHAVETLLRNVGQTVAPAVPRVAIERRRVFYGALGADFLTDTDPNNISLMGPFVNGQNTGLRAKAWITIAPDWEGLDTGTSFRLSLTADPTKVLATTRWARLLPEQILGAAGYTLASTSARTVTLTYAAMHGTQTSAQATFSLTFGPADSLSEQVHAPIVPAVVTGSTIPVTYDLTNVSNLSNPTLIVSDPGRLTPPWCSCSFHVRYSLPLSAPAGTVQVPVSALEGAGVYGIGIQTGVDAFNNPLRSDFAFTRVAPSISSRPPAPLFSSNGSAPSHVIDIPNGGSFQVSWDATNVPGANGAILEASAAGPTTRGNYNTFNNPNGSVRDQNGLDGGSLYYAPLAGVKGSTSVSGSTLGLIPTLNSVLRVIATHNGTPVGEAGEVSFVSMDGVAAADGGFVNNGYAINDQGNDAFLTSGQNTATGDVLSSVETFDQKTNRVTSTVTSSTNKSIFFTPAWGTFAGDIGLFGAFDLASGTSSYNLLNPVATGTIGTPWTSPDPNLLEAAQNDGGDTTAFLAGTPGPGGSYHVFSSNLTANTSGPEYDISAPISSFAYGFYNWIAENPGTNTAVVAGADLFGNCTAPVIDTINLTNGQQVSSTGLGAGYAEGLAVDPSTNRAFVLSSCDNGIETYDLASHTGTLTTTGGFLNLYAAVDQQRKELLVTQLEGDDASYNNNALSNVLVLNEDGTPVKTIERFNFFNGFLPFESNSLQINSGLHQGYIWGYLTQQLEPFTY